jgi:hypothetical protein
MFKDIKTTVGGLICLAAVIGLLAHWIDINACVVLLGIGGSAIGFASKDSGTTPTVTTASVSQDGITATKTTVEDK